MTAVAPKITAIAPWFGSKRTLAPRIVAELGEHSAYWEPFCGSMAVLLAMDPCSSETVNDLHGELINLARVLKDESLAVDLYGRLNRFVMHEDLFHEAAERWKARGNTPAPEAPCIDRAEEFMVCSWFGRNGVAGTDSYNQGFSVRYTKNGGHAATRWRSVVESIPPWHSRLFGVTILNRCAFVLLAKIDDQAGVVIYVDSPYIVKGANYVHDFHKPCPECGRLHTHEEMAGLLRRFKRTRVVVSYYEHPLLADYYRGWTKVECPTTKALVSQGKREKGHSVQAPEVLLINGPSFTSEGGLFA